MRIKMTTDNAPQLSPLMDEFISFKVSQKVVKRTIDDYRKTFERFLNDSSNSTDYQTVKNEVAKFFEKIPDTSPAVFNRPYSDLNALFNWMVRQDYLPKNPLKDLELKKRIDEGNVSSADIEDVKKLLKACNKKSFTGLRDYTAILVMLDTGIRTSELCRLERVDYHQEEKAIVITKIKAKTRKQRTLYLSDFTASALNKYLRHLPQEIEYIFPSRDCKQLTTNNLDKEFRRLCGKAGVKFTPYQLRHSFATYFVENGGNLFVLQQLMGHSDLRMTKRYTDISENQKKKQHNEFSPIKDIQPNRRISL